MDMNYLDNLPILRDLYYRLSEKKIFFEDERDNRKLVEDYIKDYCEKYGMLDKYRYFVEHIMLLRVSLFKGREIQQEEFNGTLGLNYEDRFIKEALENWNTDDRSWHRDWVAFHWHKNWNNALHKENFIQEYGKEYIDEIVKEIEVINKERETK